MRKIIVVLCVICLSFIQTYAQQAKRVFFTFNWSGAFISNVSDMNTYLHNIYPDYKTKNLPASDFGIGVGYSLNNRFSFIIDENMMGATRGQGSSQYRRLYSSLTAIKGEYNIINKVNYALSFASGISLNVSNFQYLRKDMELSYNYQTLNSSVPIELTIWAKSKDNKILMCYGGFFIRYNINIWNDKTKVTGIDREIKGNPTIGVNSLEIGVKLRLY